MKDSPTLMITGGASGLGLALARKAAARGWRVAIADNSESRGEAAAQALASSGSESLFLLCDVRRDGEVRTAVQRVVRRWGRLDMLINNAGVASTGLFETLSDADWQWQLDTNLLGTVHACRAAVSEMQRQGCGHIINIAAIEAHLPSPGMAAWSATQAAIQALTETLYSELAPLGIKVSLALPGFYRSNLDNNLRSADPIMRARFQRHLRDHDLSSDQLAELILRGIDRNAFLIVPPGALARWRGKRWRPGRFWRQMQALAARYRR